MRRTILRLVVAFAATALLALPHSAPDARAATAPTATFTKDSGWGTGYQGKYTITNGGSTTLNGWKVEFDVPAGGSVASYWDALMTQSGTHYTFTNRDYNGTLAPGASAGFGWVGAPESATPLNCRLNGQPCAGGGGGGGDTSPPTTPTGLRVSGTTSSSVSLAWTASTDDVGVADYRVYEGSTVVGHVDHDQRDDRRAGREQQPHLHRHGAGRGGERVRQERGGHRHDAVRWRWRRLVPEGRLLPPVGHLRPQLLDQEPRHDGRGRQAHRAQLRVREPRPDQPDLPGDHEGTSTNPEDPDQGTGAGDAYADYGASVSAANSVDGVGDTWDQTLKGNFNQITKLKAKYPNLKVLVSIGGWTYSKFFSDAAKTDASRKKLVSSCIDMFIKGNLPVVVRRRPAARAPAPASSTASTSTGSGPAPGRPPGQPLRPAATRRTSPRCSRSSAAS